MAFTYGFYDSKEGDRRYNATQMSSIFDGVIEDGVFASIGDQFAVAPGVGLQVTVGTGRAWFKHTWNYNDAKLPLNLAAADVTLKRIDAVVIEIDSTLTVRRNRIMVVQGLAETNPQKPHLISTDKKWQIPLAYVTVNARATSITKSNIETCVGKTACPYVTAPLQKVDVTQLFNQWDGEFNEWFDNVKLQLTDNVVTNLQRQIDERVKYTDKATVSQMVNGVSTNKYVSSYEWYSAFYDRRANSTEAISGTNNLKFISPFTNEAHFNSKKATADEVAAGVDIYKYVNPRNLNKAISDANPDKVVDSITGEVLSVHTVNDGFVITTMGGNQNIISVINGSNSYIIYLGYTKAGSSNNSGGTIDVYKQTINTSTDGTIMPGVSTLLKQVQFSGYPISDISATGGSIGGDTSQCVPILCTLNANNSGNDLNGTWMLVHHTKGVYFTPRVNLRYFLSVMPFGHACLYSAGNTYYLFFIGWTSVNNNTSFTHMIYYKDITNFEVTPPSDASNYFTYVPTGIDSNIKNLSDLGFVGSTLILYSVTDTILYIHTYNAVTHTFKKNVSVTAHSISGLTLGRGFEKNGELFVVVNKHQRLLRISPTTGVINWNSVISSAQIPQAVNVDSKIASYSFLATADGAYGYDAGYTRVFIGHYTSSNENYSIIATAPDRSDTTEVLLNCSVKTDYTGPTPACTKNRAYLNHGYYIVETRRGIIKLKPHNIIPFHAFLPYYGDVGFYQPNRTWSSDIVYVSAKAYIGYISGNSVYNIIPNIAHTYNSNSRNHIVCGSWNYLMCPEEKLSLEVG